MSVTHGRLILVCGLPGSGKTTHATTLEQESRAVRLCPDDWMRALLLDVHDEASRERIEQLQWTLGRRLLALGLTVIVEWGTWGRWERDRLREGARALGASVELHYLSAPMRVLFERIQKRNAETPAITWEAVQGWAAVFEAPTPEEAALYDVFQSSEV